MKTTYDNMWSVDVRNTGSRICRLVTIRDPLGRVTMSEDILNERVRVYKDSVKAMPSEVKT